MLYETMFGINLRISLCNKYGLKLKKKKNLFKKKEINNFF